MTGPTNQRQSALTHRAAVFETKICPGKLSSEIVGSVSRIHNAAFSELGQSGWSEQSVDSLAGTNGAALIAAFTDKQMAGFILTRYAADEAELLTLAVDPGFQRAGIASLLINAAKEELEKQAVKSFFLEVRRDNAAAVACYKKLGFEKIAVRKNYYTDDTGTEIDADVFRLLL